jgi:phosphoribosyl 1,2-cyclic phosphodiesterase
LGSETDVAVCTDLGVMTEDIKNAFAGCSLVMLESNHDPVMLRMGPYPAELKVRISSDHGHLSNGVCAETLAWLYDRGATRFVLAHLSEINNDPEKAATLTRAALIDKGAVENRDYILYVAKKEGNRVIPL